MKRSLLLILLLSVMMIGQTHNTIHRTRNFPSDTLGWYWRMWNVNSSGLLVATHTVDKMTALTTESWSAGPPPYTLWMFNIANWPAPAWQNGDKLIMQADRDSAYGTLGHKGFYAIVNDTVNGTVNPQFTMDDTLWALPRPMPFGYDSIHGDTAFTSANTIQMIWNKPKQLPGNPVTNNIIGYQVWRDTLGIGEDDTLALGVLQYFYLKKSVTDTFCIDSLIGFDNRSLFYAIKLIYRPDTNPKLTSKFLSRNSPRIIKTPPIGIEEGSGRAGSQSALTVAPNPFTGVVRISVEQTGGNREIVVYDINGCVVKSFGVLAAEQMPFGQLYWNGRDNQGGLLPAGVYFVEVKTTSGTLNQKVILER